MALDWLTGTTTNPTVTTQSENITGLPAWYQQYLSGLIGRTSQVVGEPYQPYTQPRVAGFNTDQTNAYGMTRAGIGQYQPMLEQGSDMVAGAGGGFNETEFNKYLNPMTSNVMDEIARRGGRNLGENLLPQVNTTFTGAGQFGSSRHEDFTARALRDTNEAILGEQARTGLAGYSQAMGDYQKSQDRTLTAGKEMGALATSGQGMGLRDAASLEAVGAAQKGQDQQNLDVAYQDFLEQRDYPRNNAAFMSSIIRGLPVNQSTTTTSTAPANQNQLAPSGLGQLAGLGIGGLSLYKLLGLRRGGPVRRYAHGGRVAKARPRPRGLGAMARA